MSYRLGVDVGGTFTDIVCTSAAGDLLLDKVPTTPEDQSIGVMDGIARVAERLGVDLATFLGDLDVLVHGTTTADNTMIEMDGAPTGLLATEGHRDEIELRRVHKEAIWDPAYPAPIPIARRRARIPIPERIDHTGAVLLPLDEEAVRRGVRRLHQLGVRSIAVLYLFSYVDPTHELRTRELILDEYPDVEHISLSHEVLPAGPEFERTSTTLVNAYVAPRVAAYTGRLVERLRAAGYAGHVQIVQATGGVLPPEHVVRRAVTLLGSGPTGGVLGAAVAAGAAGAPDFLAVDMGGTSFDMCLVRGGTPEIRTDRNWRYRYYIGVPMVDVRSIGAGGGSIARVREGALLVGPESAGAVPGPACYGRGGDHATVTDADAVLGYLPVEGFAGGRMTLDVDASRAALERDVAGPLSLDVVAAAWGIERIVNANMANGMRRVLAGYGADPRELALVAYGGNGAVRACALAEELGAGRVLVPTAAPVFSALGCLCAEPAVDLVRSYVTPISQVDLDRLRGLLDELVLEAGKELPGRFEAALHVQMAYSGQNADTSVPVPEGSSIGDAGLLDLAERFHDLHEADRGFAFRQQQPQIRGVRLVAHVHTEKPARLAVLGEVTSPADASLGERAVWFGDAWTATPVVDGSLLGPGFAVTGPCLVQEPFTVVTVAPGWQAVLGGHGSYDLTRVE